MRKCILNVVLKVGQRYRWLVDKDIAEYAANIWTRNDPETDGTMALDAYDLQTDQEQVVMIRMSDVSIMESTDVSADDFEAMKKSQLNEGFAQEPPALVRTRPHIPAPFGLRY